jgi:hypothetical protein
VGCDCAVADAIEKISRLALQTTLVSNFSNGAKGVDDANGANGA